MGGFDQKPRSLTQPNLVETFDKGFTSAFFDKTAERQLAHVDDFGYVGQLNDTVEIFVHKAEGVLNVTTVVADLLADETRIGQRPHVARGGQIV